MGKDNQKIDVLCIFSFQFHFNALFYEVVVVNKRCVNLHRGPEMKLYEKWDRVERDRICLQRRGTKSCFTSIHINCCLLASNPRDFSSLHGKFLNYVCILHARLSKRLIFIQIKCRHDDLLTSCFLQYVSANRLLHNTNKPISYFASAAKSCRIT